MKKIALALALVFASSNAIADSANLIIGGFSKHYKNDEMNEKHPAIGVEIDNFSIVYTSKNSINKPSAQLAYSDTFYNYGIFDVGYRVGLMTGYRYGTKYANNRWYDGVDLGAGIAPLAAIDISVDTPIPSVKFVTSVTPSVTLFGLKIELW